MTPQDLYDLGIQLSTQGYSIDIDLLAKALKIEIIVNNPKVEWHESPDTEDLRKRCAITEKNRYGL